MPEFDLKLQGTGPRGGGGAEVTWDGKDELDAARNYVASHRDAVVVATRPHRIVNDVLVWGGARIIEPGDKG